MPAPPGPPWLRSVVGDDLFASVARVVLADSAVNDTKLEHLKALAQLQHLCLHGAKVSNAGLENIDGLTQLRSLIVGCPNVSDAGLEHLKGLTQLDFLDLRGTKVSGTGLRHLKGLSQLRVLYLYNTEVNDAGLQHLKGLTQLEKLDLRNTRVTDAGLQYLRGLTRLELLGFTALRSAAMAWRNSNRHYRTARFLTDMTDPNPQSRRDEGNCRQERAVGRSAKVSRKDAKARTEKGERSNCPMCMNSLFIFSPLAALRPRAFA